MFCFDQHHAYPCGGFLIRYVLRTFKVAVLLVKVHEHLLFCLCIEFHNVVFAIVTNHLLDYWVFSP